MNYRQIILDFIYGLYDSCRGIILIYSLDKQINERKKKQDSPSRASAVRQRNFDSRENTPVRQIKKPKQSSVLMQSLQCGGLNGGIYLASIIAFDYGVLWIMHLSFGLIFGRDSFMGNLVWSWIEPTLSIIFRTVWVIPLFLLSKIVNALCFQEIADSAYEHRRGTPVSSQSISKMLADSIFSIVTQCLFLILALLINYIPIPYVGYGVSQFLLCMLYSLYTFEYKWVNMGWELPKRLSFIETNWPYFCGFGLPMVLATGLSESWVISGCIFSILFPFYIISGNEANPPTTGESEYPPARVFAPVIYVANFLFSITIGSSQKKTVTAPPVQKRR